MTVNFNRKSLALAHAASLETRLAVARWSGHAGLSAQARWQRQRQQEMVEWLVQGGFAAGTAAPQTKTAAKGRRSLASQRDSDEEYKFTQLRIRDAAA
jgi:hypothetical protein